MVARSVCSPAEENSRNASWFHGARWNDGAMSPAAGEHTLRATIQRVAPGARPNWVVGVAYGDSLQWVPDAML